MRGGPVRALVQGAGPEPIFAGRLGQELILLQGPQGKCSSFLPELDYYIQRDLTTKGLIAPPMNVIG